MKSAAEFANEAMGWLVASHSWASGAYANVVKAMEAYAHQQLEPLEAELQRLREELDQCHSDAGFVIPALRETLAAHQAVVRELVEALHPFAFPTEFKDSFIVMGRDVNRAREVLAYPLVVAAQRAGRD